MKKNKNDTLRNIDLKKVMILYPELDIISSSDYDHLINIHNAAESIYGTKLDLSLVKNAFNQKYKMRKLSSNNDYLYLLSKSLGAPKSINKFSYPTNSNRDFEAEFDISKWADLVYKIYEKVGIDGADFNETLDSYSKTLDTKRGEDESFKKWVKYFKTGEHLKYSKDESLKKSAWSFSVSPPANPNQQNAVVPGLVFQEAQAMQSNNQDYQNWVSGLNRAIRSVDNLLRKGYRYLEPDIQKELFNLLHQFSNEIVSLRSPVTASDLAFKYANRFKKLGFDSGYNELIKYAQQAGSVDSVEGTPASAAPAATAATAPANPTQAPTVTPAAVTPDATVQPSGVAPEAGAQQEEPKTPLERALQPIAESKEKEYESIIGNVDLGDAVAKLEDIASRLSDRRTIRLLAEFDIILDKIGIAPMFPELAEAQSKLIDAYSYALVRVTKMLGMLSSGKSIIEISDSKKKELISKTMKEVNRGIAAGEEYEASKAAAESAGEAPEAAPTEKTVKGPEETQAGVQEAGLAAGTPTEASLPPPTQEK